MFDSIMRFYWSFLKGWGCLRPQLKKVGLTAISLQADIDIPVPSICFSAYSFSSFLWREKQKEVEVLLLDGRAAQCSHVKKI